VRGQKLVGLFSRPGIPQPGQTVSLKVINTDAGSEIGVSLAEGISGGQLSHINQLFSVSGDMHTAGTVNVVPHRQKFTLLVKDLDTEVFPVGHENSPILIQGYTMR
jgi:hypothetical protein